MFCWWHGWRIFAEKSAAVVEDLLSECELSWRNVVESVAENCERGHGVLDSFFVGNVVDSVGETADDEERIFLQKSNYFSRLGCAVERTSASSDKTDGVRRGKISPEIELFRGFVDVAEKFGIVGTSKRDGANIFHVFQCREAR